jgi:hypothetical protein
MAGLLPLVSGRETNQAAPLSALNERLYEIQRQGGFESYGQAAEQFAASAEYTMKGVMTAPEQQALLSAFAIGGQGNTAAELLSQVIRATSAGIMRDRGMKPAEGYQQDYQRSARYFKSLGITTKTRAADRFLPILENINRKEDEARRRGEYFSPMDYLMEKGFINQEDREAIAKLAGMHRTGQLAALPRMARAPVGEQPTGAIEGSFRQGFAKDPFLQERQIAQEGDLERQQRAQQELFKATITRQAYVALGGEEHFKEKYKTVMDRASYNPVEAICGSRRQVEWKAQQLVVEEAAKAGLDTSMAWRNFTAKGEATGER